MTKATVIRLAGDHEIAGALADSLMAQQLQAAELENNMLRQRVSDLEREISRFYSAQQDNAVLHKRVNDLEDALAFMHLIHERDNTRRLAEARERYGRKPRSHASRLLNLGLALGLIEEDATL